MMTPQYAKGFVVMGILLRIVFPVLIATAEDDFEPSVYEQVLNTLERLTPGNSITVEMETEKGQYTAGEPIEMRFRVSANSYLVLMRIAADGNITFLLPNARVPQLKVEGKRVYSTRSDFQIDLQGSSTSGAEILNLFCSPEPFNLFEAKLSEQKPYYTMTPKDDKQLKTLLRRLEQLQKQVWSGNSVTVWMAEPARKSEAAVEESAPQALFMMAPRGAIPVGEVTGSTNKFFPPINTTGTTGKTEKTNSSDKP
jgi:hypothetical protein